MFGINFFGLDYQRVCLRHLRKNGWKVWPANAMDEYGARCGDRRAYIIFAKTDDVTETKVTDWQLRKQLANASTYVFTELTPHPHFVHLASMRGIILRNYRGIIALNTTVEDRAAEQKKRITDRYEIKK